MPRLTASDFHIYHQPEKCESRVYLKAVGTQGSDPSAYAEVLKRLGLQFEQQHLASFTNYLDLRGKSRIEREDETRAAVKRNERVIYQPALKAIHRIGSIEVEIVGDPDFLICVEGVYTIRDVKLARRINETDHPGILRQLELYGWLFQKTFGTPPSRIEIYTGKNESVRVDFDGGSQALAELEKILGIKNLSEPPYSPVGWSKCNPCTFKSVCWETAEKNRDVALVYGVDQSLARALRAQGVLNFDQLVSQFDVTSLAEFKRPRGEKMQRVGKSAENIIQMARSLISGKEIKLASPELPVAENYAMFDLEGLPPHMDDLQKIYLWGIQVYGVRSGGFLPAIAGFGEDGDRDGWIKFLENADTIFCQFGEIPFIHWHHYEATNIKMYIERFGDPSGVAERVLENMVDILPLVKKCVALPLPSYSLKAVEKYIGFKRTQDEFGGDWSIAKYIEATETNDHDLRQKTMDAILTYNKEDLAATWAVFDWFRKKNL